MKVNIISYFGQGDMRPLRLKYHQQQIDWFLSKGFSTADIRISYRDYKPEEFIDGITYTSKPTTGIQGIVDGRNEMLEEFYASDDDWAMFCDNDTVLDDRNKGDIISELRYGNMFGNIGIFTPINPATPGRGAFNKVWETDPVDTHWCFKRGTTSGKMMFIKNVKKYTGTSLYFSHYPAGEDIIFGYEFAKIGLAPMWCHNVVINEFAKKASDEMTWKDDADTTSRSVYSDIYKKTAVDNFPGMEIKNGKLFTVKYFENNRIPNIIQVPKNNNVGLMNFM